MTDSVCFFNEALKEAKKALELDEVPVGAVVVCNNTIIARAHNKKEQEKNSLAHAELLAIQEAQTVIGDWRLTDCDLYVTLEPCVMCMGAIFHARFRSLYYGARDLKWGGETLFNMASQPRLNHKLYVEDVQSQESADLLTNFFKQKRQ
jgi:tRNA(adenine34) deaminase